MCFLIGGHNDPLVDKVFHTPVTTPGVSMFRPGPPGRPVRNGRAPTATSEAPQRCGEAALAPLGQLARAMTERGRVGSFVSSVLIAC